jgi:hypothetical protein
MHYSKRFLKEVWEPLQASVEAGMDEGELRLQFRDACLAIGHEERCRNLYRVRHKLDQEAQFFVPNGPQEKFLASRSGRDICLKTRQIGMTTLSCIRALDMALWEENAATGLMAHKQNSTSTIFDDLVKYSYSWFKRDWGSLYSPEQKANSSTALVFTSDGLGRPLNSSMLVLYDFRGKTVNFLHVSEAAFIEPERLLGSLQAVPATGEVILESTPNGQNEFHRLWRLWETNGRQAPYKGHFTPWYSFYPENEDDERWELDLSVKPLSLEEQTLKESYGLSNTKLAWRRWCIESNCLGDPDRFENEYPSNTIDCFLTGGEAQVFAASLLKSAQKTVREPAKIGFLLQDGPKVDLHPDEKKGVTHIWKEPTAGHEYSIGADPASGIGKDRSVAYVKDRNTNELVAKTEGHFDPRSFATELFKLGTFYNKAWLLVEENNHGHTVIQGLKELRYPNFYKRRVMDELTNKPTRKIGFLTTNDTKLRVTEQFKKSLTEGQLVIYDAGLISEMTSFMQYASKTGRSIKREAAAGCHDDRVMAAAFTEEMAQSRGPLSMEDEGLSSIPTSFDPETGFAF